MNALEGSEVTEFLNMIGDESIEDDVVQPLFQAMKLSTIQYLYSMTINTSISLRGETPDTIVTLKRRAAEEIDRRSGVPSQGHKLRDLFRAIRGRVNLKVQ
jgi:hypothetical protein